MNTLFNITYYLFIFWIFRNIFFYLFLWQVKEYRLDRMKVHLKETEQGGKILFSSRSIVKWIIIFAFVFTLFHDEWISIYEVVVFLLYFFEFLFILKEVLSGNFKRPRLNGKSLIIFLLSLGVLFFISLFPIISRSLWLLAIDRITVLIVSFFVWIFSFPTELYRDWKVERATKKIRKLKDLLVIGITGSYGKSSTKEYIAQILEKKFKLIKTSGTNNTPIGIANTILSKLKKDTEIFVVEMGAYKRGEIAQICNIVRPRIGILTSVSSQHLSLFGSLEKTIQTKYELIESLPKYGLALFNGNNANAYSLYEKALDKERGDTPRQVAMFETLYNSKDVKAEYAEPDIIAYNVRVKKDHIEFDAVVKLPNLKTGRKIESITAPVIGVHAIENILPGIYLGSYFGMMPKEIKEAIAAFSPLSQTMTLLPTKRGAAFVDDSFNSNPQAIIASLNYMKLYKEYNGVGGKKFLVLNPIIELGKRGREEHFKIAKIASGVCDYLLVTNKNFYQELSDGIRMGEGKCELMTLNIGMIADFIEERTGRNDVVVFEGKEAGNVLKKLMKRMDVSIFPLILPAACI